jgi:hypothetical protein
MVRRITWHGLGSKPRHFRQVVLGVVLIRSLFQNLRQIFKRIYSDSRIVSAVGSPTLGLSRLSAPRLSDCGIKGYLGRSPETKYLRRRPTRPRTRRQYRLAITLTEKHIIPIGFYIRPKWCKGERISFILFGRLDERVYSDSRSLGLTESRLRSIPSKGYLFYMRNYGRIYLPKMPP